MKIKDLIDYGNKFLHKDKVKLLLGDILGYNPLELYNYLDETIEEEKCNKFKSLVEAIKENTPIQYALGKTCFYGRDFIVNKNVLIPRFETEELVDNTIKYINKYFTNSVEIIDLGCGSGAIGITLKKELPASKVTLLDISDEALEVSNQNKIKLQADVNIIKGDMLDSIENKYDVIISNPPYIKTDEEIEEIVKNNEPHLALYGGKDGLYFYDKILSKVKDNLKDKAIIAFEIGYEQKEDITKLVYKYLDNVKVVCKKDMQNRDRMLFIFKNCE